MYSIRTIASQLAMLATPASHRSSQAAAVGQTGYAQQVAPPANQQADAGGDTVSLSSAARQFSDDLYRKEKGGGQLPDEVASMTLPSGRTVIIETVTFDPPEPALENTPGIFTDERRDTLGRQFGFRVHVIGENGQPEQSFMLDQDVILNEDADGNLLIGEYTKGAETSGNDLIIGLGGNDLRGGGGDDTLVDLSHAQRDAESSSVNTLRSLNIFGGDGDDNVVVVGDLAAAGTISTGAGHDRVQVTGRAVGTIDTGSGNDWADIFLIDGALNTGAGNDVVDSVAVFANGAVDTGDESDVLDVHYLYGSVHTGKGDDAARVSLAAGTLNTGSGNDYVAGNMLLNVITGSGDDVVNGLTVGADTGSGDDTVHAGVAMDIETGDGDDTVLADSIHRTLSTGDGDDTVHATGTVYGTVLTGAGNDALRFEQNILGTVRTGSGDDALHAARSVYGVVHTGGGNDAVTINRLASGLLTTGTGSDAVSIGSAMNSIVRTGSGNDTLELEAESSFSSLETGSSDDTIRGGTALDSTYIGSGSGADRLELTATFMHNSVVYTGSGNDYFYFSGDLVQGGFALSGSTE